MRLQSTRSWRPLLFSLLLAAPLTSAGPGDEEGGRPVSLTFAVLKTQAGHHTIHGGRLGLELRPGEGSSVFSLTPHQDEGRLDQGCGAVPVTMSVGPPAASPGSPVAWRVQARVLEASLDGIRVEVSWTRLVAEGGAGFVEGRVAPPEVATLDPGDRLLLDFVEDPPFPRQGCIENLALELSASFPVVEEATGLAYEIWMVHEDPSGRTESRKWMSRSLQGEEATFRFPRTDLRTVQSRTAHGVLASCRSRGACAARAINRAYCSITARRARSGSRRHSEPRRSPRRSRHTCRAWGPSFGTPTCLTRAFRVNHLPPPQGLDDLQQSPDRIHKPTWTGSGLWRVWASGRTPVEVTRPDREKGETGHFWADVLPDGRAALFTIFGGKAQADSKVGLLDLETGHSRHSSRGRRLSTSRPDESLGAPCGIRSSWTQRPRMRSPPRFAEPATGRLASPLGLVD